MKLQRIAVALVALTVGFSLADLLAQGRANVPPPDPTKPHKLEVTTGTRARYKVREQLAGISFPSDAVGTTEAITGAIVIKPDGSIDAAQSKLSVDLKTLTSDQQMRDGYVQNRTLETAKFPTMEFVPKRAVGLPAPLPAGMQAQAGFQLIGDLTLHGVTKEATWNVVATFGNDTVGGRATTTIDFASYGMTKPSLARLMSVDDKIELEIEFRCKRTVVTGS
ncbi:MAG TPA: YceI family protein [Vicinamibacterales bacterium]|nr:YceI family protein [Vicinamibacterales bacterium]